MRGNSRSAHLDVLRLGGDIFRVLCLLCCVVFGYGFETGYDHGNVAILIRGLQTDLSHHIRLVTDLG